MTKHDARLGENPHVVAKMNEDIGTGVVSCYAIRIEVAWKYVSFVVRPKFRELPRTSLELRAAKYSQCEWFPAIHLMCRCCTVIAQHGTTPAKRKHTHCLWPTGSELPQQGSLFSGLCNLRTGTSTSCRLSSPWLRPSA